MGALTNMYQRGVKAALMKFALDPPTQVDQFMAAVESGKDIPPPLGDPMDPSMSQGAPPALDGTTPLSTSPPTPMDTVGSTVGEPPLAGAPGEAPPSMGMLGG